jgi:hypothetical protein
MSDSFRAGPGRKILVLLESFVKLVHLVGFIIRILVTMHGHMNVKTCAKLVFWQLRHSRFIFDDPGINCENKYTK